MTILFSFQHPSQSRAYLCQSLLEFTDFPSFIIISMGRSVNVNLIDLQIQKQIGLTVDDESRLCEISQYLTTMFKNSNRGSFRYRQNVGEIWLDEQSVVRDLMRGSEDVLVLYVDVDKKVKKDNDTCCVIY